MHKQIHAPVCDQHSFNVYTFYNVDNVEVPLSGSFKQFTDSFRVTQSGLDCPRIGKNCQRCALDCQRTRKDCKMSVTDYQGRNIDCNRSEMNIEARTIDCQRSEMDYQGIDCQRRNMNLPGRSMDPQRKRINYTRRNIDHQRRNTDCKGNEENIYSEPVFDDDSTYEDHRRPDHGDRSVTSQHRNDKSRMKVLETIPPM